MLVFPKQVKANSMNLEEPEMEMVFWKKVMLDYVTIKMGIRKVMKLQEFIPLPLL